jgi:very-short-patch-repair endonuclease
MASALQRAIQLVYQLEESELAVDFLPDVSRRRLLLFYESAEGGAGVLRRLAADSDAMARVAQRALEVCHFDPETGKDLRRALGAREDCEAACYDCLMSYVNQPDHRLLDRKLIKEILAALARSRVEASPAALSREQHLERLLRKCQTELERSFLRFLETRGIELPSDAQVFIEVPRARPDFLYDGHQTVVFIDGPVHQYPNVVARDGQAARRLEDAGYTVIRFLENESTWPETVARWPSVFGRMS